MYLKLANTQFPRHLYFILGVDFQLPDIVFIKNTGQLAQDGFDLFVMALQMYASYNPERFETVKWSPSSYMGVACSNDVFRLPD